MTVTGVRSGRRSERATADDGLSSVTAAGVDAGDRDAGSRAEAQKERVTGDNERACDGCVRV